MLTNEVYIKKEKKMQSVNISTEWTTKENDQREKQACLSRTVEK